MAVTFGVESVAAGSFVVPSGWADVSQKADGKVM